jgi:hypothetical protein
MLLPAFLNKATFCCQQSFAPPVHVPNALGDESLWEPQGCASEAGQVLSPGLPIPTRPLLLLQPHASVDLLPDRRIQDIQVRAATWNLEGMDLGRNLSRHTLR